MGASLTTLSNILKEFYLGPVQEQLNNEILVNQILKVDTENLEGLKAVIPLHSGRSSGIGARGELVTLPTAGNQAYQRATYDLKYHYARVQVSGPSIAKTKDESGAFLQALKSELDYIKNDVAMDFARQVYGDGSGKVAICGTTTASTTVVLGDAGEAINKGFLYVGMSVDIGTVAAPDTISGAGTPRTITDLSPSANTITISGAAVTTSSSHFIFRAGNVTASTVYEMDCGLSSIVSSSTGTAVGTLNPATAGLNFWDNLRDTSGGAISLSNLMLNWNKVNANGAKSDGVAVVTTPGLARRLFATADFTTNVRFVDSQTLNGGFEQITFSVGTGKLPLTTDRHAPYGKVFMVDKKHVRMFSPADWDFLSRDGLTIRWVDSLDAFQAILYRYANMGTDRRNTSLVMSGLTDTGF